MISRRSPMGGGAASAWTAISLTAQNWPPIWYEPPLNDVAACPTLLRGQKMAFSKVALTCCIAVIQLICSGYRGQAAVLKGPRRHSIPTCAILTYLFVSMLLKGFCEVLNAHVLSPHDAQRCQHGCGCETEEGRPGSEGPRVTSGPKTCSWKAARG